MRLWMVASTTYWAVPPAAGKLRAQCLERSLLQPAVTLRKVVAVPSKTRGKEVDFPGVFSGDI